MKVLVTGGSHPNERHATEIFYALKRENDNPSVLYEAVPFSETMQSHMNKALKLLQNQEEIERRLAGGNRKERKLSRQIIYIVRDDLKEPKKENRENVERFYLELEDGLHRGGNFFGRFPELEDAMDSAVHEKFLVSALERQNADIGVDIHNSGFDASKGKRKPFICDVPEKGERIGLNRFLLRRKGYFIEKIPPQDSDPFYGIEIPADAIKPGFSGYAVIGLMFGNEEYYEQFFDPNLPVNRRNFDYQKKIVKEMIDEIAAFKI